MDSHCQHCHRSYQQSYSWCCRNRWLFGRCHRLARCKHQNHWRQHNQIYVKRRWHGLEPKHQWRRHRWHCWLQCRHNFGNNQFYWRKNSWPRWQQHQRHHKWFVGRFCWRYCWLQCRHNQKRNKGWQWWHFINGFQSLCWWHCWLQRRHDWKLQLYCQLNCQWHKYERNHKSVFGWLCWWHCRLQRRKYKSLLCWLGKPYRLWRWICRWCCWLQCRHNQIHIFQWHRTGRFKCRWYRWLQHQRKHPIQLCPKRCKRHRNNQLWWCCWRINCRNQKLLGILPKYIIYWRWRQHRQSKNRLLPCEHGWRDHSAFWFRWSKQHQTIHIMGHHCFWRHWWILLCKRY